MGVGMVHPSARPPTLSALDRVPLPPRKPPSNVPSPTHSLSPVRSHSDPLSAHPNDMSKCCYSDGEKGGSQGGRERGGDEERGREGTCPSWVASVLLLSLFPGADCRGVFAAFFASSGRNTIDMYEKKRVGVRKRDGMVKEEMYARCRERGLGGREGGREVSEFVGASVGEGGPPGKMPRDD